MILSQCISFCLSAYLRRDLFLWSEEQAYSRAMCSMSNGHFHSDLFLQIFLPPEYHENKFAYKNWFTVFCKSILFFYCFYVKIEVFPLHDFLKYFIINTA